MQSLARFAAFCGASAVAAEDISIATFDGAEGTTLDWHTINDPVMGGQSSSKFHVDSADDLGIWEGEVKIVPFLQQPGFCTLRSPGLYQKGTYPKLSGTDGVVVKMSATGLGSYSVQMSSKITPSPEAAYVAAFNASGDLEDHFLAWGDFKCTIRGQPYPDCPALVTQLDQIASVGLSTFFPGLAGVFNVSISSIIARGGDIRKKPIMLEDFSAGKPLHTWHSENDPVMGGQSESAFSVGPDHGEYQGTCRIVPKLQAPGFTIAMTANPLFANFPDVSSMDGLMWRVKNAGGNISSFKVAFCDSRIYFKCQFGSYKADVTFPQSNDYADIFVPWSAFSNKWSAQTGEHTAENPPTASSLRSITQLQLWTEGVAGTFELQVQSVEAVLTPGAKFPEKPAPSLEQEQHWVSSAMSFFHYSSTSAFL